MKVLNKKIKAFTIAEMLAVLVISSIVISLTMLILSLIQKQVSTIDINYDHNTEMRLLERTLWQDLNEHNARYNPTKRQLQCVSENDTVNYMFGSNFVIRNRDTLKIRVVKADLYLEGSIAKGGYIDALELQISRENTDKMVFVYKIKDAAFYVNDKEHLSF